MSDAPATNLPAPLTTFIGRQDDLVELRRLLGAHRLVTLTGAAGSGKTRLALEAAVGLRDASPDGVWLVELATLTDPAHVPEAVAAALGLREQPGLPPIATLARALRTASLLLVLDNCEHLLDACAMMTETLLRDCPSVRVLATGREALGVASEVTWTTPPLRLPPIRPLPPVEELLDYDAIALFVARARVAQPRFELTPETAPAAAEVCARLDGLPLAVELAAARLRAMGVADLAARLDDRFRLLTGGARTALPRHRTLRAAVSWSYDLLTAPEQVLFRRLSVFVGGFTLDAAEAIGGTEGGGRGGESPAGDSPPRPPPSVLDLLVALVEKSLVVAEPDAAGAIRYRLLETLRQYGRERLEEPGEGDAARRRHQDWCLALVEQAAPLLAAAGQLPWLGRLDVEHDNLRAALATCLADGDALSLRLAAGLWPYWRLRGRLTEGRRWLEECLDRCETMPTVWQAQALHGAGMLAVAQGDFPAARARLEASLAVSRALGEPAATAWTLRELGMLLPLLGESESGRALLTEALAKSRAIGDRLAEGASLAGLGWLMIRDGDYRRARAALEAALPLLRAGGDRLVIAFALRDLGRLLADQGEYDSARARLAESELVARELGWQDVMTRLYRAQAALWQGRLPEARAQFAAGFELARAVGDQDGLASHQLGLGWLAALDGDTHAAARLLEESLAIAMANGSRAVQAPTLYWLGRLAAGQGDAARATALLRESLVIRRALGYRRGIAECLEALAAIGIAAAPPAPERGLRLLAAAAALRAAIGAPLPPVEQPGHEEALRAARRALGEAAFAAAWAAGQALTPEAALAEALTGQSLPADRARPPLSSPPPAPSADPNDLTPRELAMLVRLAAGRSSREIAAELSLSLRTVDRHINRLYRKIGARNRTEATLYALRRGLAAPYRPDG